MITILDTIQNFVTSNETRRISMFIDAQREILRLQAAQREEDLDYKNSVTLEWDTVGNDGHLKSSVQNDDILKVLKPLGFCAVIDHVMITELGLYTVRAVMDSHVYRVKTWIVPR
jgi:predicted methyltransferase